MRCVKLTLPLALAAEVAVDHLAVDLEQLGRHVAEAGGRGDGQAPLHVGDDRGVGPEDEARRRPPAAAAEPSAGGVAAGVVAGAAAARRLCRRGGAAVTGAAGAVAATGAAVPRHRRCSRPRERSRVPARGSRRRTPASSRSPTAGPPGTARTSRRRARRWVRTALPRPLPAMLPSRAARPWGPAPRRERAGADRYHARRHATPDDRQDRGRLGRPAPARPRVLWRRRVGLSSARRPGPLGAGARHQVRPAGLRRDGGDVEVAYVSKGQQVHSMVLEDADGGADPRLPAAGVDRASRWSGSVDARRGRLRADLRHPGPRGRRQWSPSSSSS